MKKNIFLLLANICIMLTACNTGTKDFDAAGNFEADEVIVSAQQNGTLLSFDIAEGQTLQHNQVVGQIDVQVQILQKKQTQASISALQQKTVTPDAQVDVIRKQLSAQQAQLDQLQNEKKRTQNLVAADAAPRKQLDDINASITQITRQMAATRSQIELYQSNAAIQNRSVLSERNPIERSVAVIQNQIEKGQIINPVAGTVLTKYAMQGEMAGVGKPLYKVANIDTINLRAYVTGDQLFNIKTGQAVTIRIEDGNEGYKSYPGTIYWISDKSEFTPKTIQTKKERENLVYAIKVRVKNDGHLKIGMYGEVLFNSSNK